MAINATAVLTTDIDSTKVLKKVQEITAKLSSIAASKIAPVFDLDEAQKAVEHVYGRLKSMADMVIKPTIDVKGIEAVDTTKAASAFEAQFKNVMKVAQQLSTDISNIFSSLDSKVAGGAKGNKSKALAQDMNKLAASTRESRKSIVDGFADIVSQATALKNVAPETIASAESIFQGLKKSLENAGGGKVAFKSFFGKVPAADLREAMQGYKDAIETASKSFSDMLGKSSATSVPLANNLVKTVESAMQVAKPVSVPIEVAKPSAGVISKAWVGVKSGLDTLSLKASEWSKIDFVRSFEWGQTTRAITSEAEAAFSAEAMGRKIFNSLFSNNKIAGYIGYTAGLWIDGILALGKKLSVALFAIPSVLAKGIAAVSSGVFGKLSASILRGISSLLAPFNAAFVFVFGALQKVFNKYTIAVASSLFMASNKLFVTVGKKIVTSIYGIGKSIFSAFKSLLSLGGLGGGSGASYGELSGFQLFSLASVATATKLAANLEEAMLKVTTITMQTGAAFKNLQSLTISLSNEFSKSAGDVAASLYDVSSAGFLGNEAFSVLRASIQAATAGMTNTSVASTAISRALRAFNLPVESATVVSDVLFNVVKRGITTFEDLAQQVTRVLTVSNVTGVSLQELGAVLAFLTRNGLKTEQAILGVQGLLKSLISPSEEAKEAAKNLGFEWNETALKQKGFIKLLQDSAPQILANKDVFKKLVGEMQGVTAALSIASKPFELTEDLTAMHERGAAAEASAQVALGFNYQLEKFWTNFVNILRNMGQIILPIIQPALEATVEMLSKLSAFANTDLSGFWAGLKSQVAFVGKSLLEMLSSVSLYLGQELLSVGATVLPYIGGIINSVGQLLIALIKKIAPHIFTFLANSLISGLGWIGKGITIFFKSIGDTLGAVLEAVMLPLNGLVWIVEEIAYWLGIIDENEKVEAKAPKFELPKEKETSIVDEMKKLTAGFAKDFEDGFSALKFDFKKNDSIIESVTSSFSKFNSDVAIAGNKILNTSSTALRDQADSMAEVLKSLEEQYKKEIAAKQNTKADITLKFIQKQKQQMKSLAESLQKSELNDALQEQQELYISLARARRDGWKKDLQLSIIEQIKDNELFIMKLEAKARSKQAFNNQVIVNQQANLYDSLKAKVLDLVKAGEKLGGGLGNLNTVLDDVFGKNVERIAKQYGVGKDIADARELARDVIEARAAGFEAADINTIVTRGLMQRSDALTNVLTAFKKYQRALSLEDVAKMGLSGQIVRLLDQAEALGLDAVGRRALLQNSLTEEALQNLDKQISGDKTVQFVEQAGKFFEGVSEERKLQERFNAAQLKVSDLTKEAVTRNQKLKQVVEELEKKIGEIEQIQGKQNQVLIQVP